MYGILGLDTNVCPLDEVPSPEKLDVIAKVSSIGDGLMLLYEIDDCLVVWEKLEEVLRKGETPGAELDERSIFDAKLVAPLLRAVGRLVLGELGYALKN